MSAPLGPLADIAHLAPLGWDAEWEAAFTMHAGDVLSPARVVAEHRGAYDVLAAVGAAPLTARVTGRLRHDALGPGDFPVVGD